uniref:Microtubule associated protein 9 n=1 Tax=Pelusios castaneus TaxID=367368 RepID=A0A8C8RSZ0_9SAUR
MADEDIGTTLAYTKSPKVSRRTTFQDELQEAISARAARQQTAEYSDDFDSDEDGMLNSSNNSAAENTVKKSVAFESILSDEETTLKKSFLKKKHQKIGGDRVDEAECSYGEESACKSDQYNQAHIAILHNEREEITHHEFENKPVPKLREHRLKNGSSSAENVSISALDDHYKPSPQPRSVLRKSSHVEGKDVARTEDKSSSSYRLSSFSAPSSLTRLSDKITSEKRALAESPSQDQTEDDDCNNFKLENNGRKSPSVIELMMTTVYEKTKKLQKSTDDQLEENLQILEEEFIADGIKEMSLDKSEDMVEVSTSHDSNKVSFDTFFLSLTSTYLKKAWKSTPPPTTTSSQYLGTLKVLDNKHLQKYSAELDKADSLRAAVYQVNFGLSRDCGLCTCGWLLKIFFFFKPYTLSSDHFIKLDINVIAWHGSGYLVNQRYLQHFFNSVNSILHFSPFVFRNEKKEEFLKQKKAEKIQEKRKQEIEQVEKEEKDKKAVDEYERWLVKYFFTLYYIYPCKKSLGAFSVPQKTRQVFFIITQGNTRGETASTQDHVLCSQMDIIC